MPTSRLLFHLPFLSGAAPGQSVPALGLDEAMLRDLAAQPGERLLLIGCRLAGGASRETNVLPEAAEAVRCDARALPLLSHAIDAVLASAATLADDAALNECRRALAPSGTLVALDDGGGQLPAAVAGLRAAGFSIEREDEGAVVARAPRGFRPAAG
ncbi:MAG TPA: methyltransferase domain-containing protein [Dehalococcoidia bacterium]|nr:methyltransferase domain-containing protein [Dehalococcoidia bacterium]